MNLKVNKLVVVIAMFIAENEFSESTWLNIVVCTSPNVEVKDEVTMNVGDKTVIVTGIS